MALAVLSLEEIGKLLHLDEKSVAEHVGDHRHKRKRVGDEFRSDLGSTAVFDMFCARFVPGCTPEAATKEEIEAHIKALEGTSPRARFLRSIADGKRTTDPKNQALYVDIAPDTWAVASDPADIGRTEAEEWLTLAHEAIQAGTPTLYALIGDEEVVERVTVIPLEGAA